MRKILVILFILGFAGTAQSKVDPAPSIESLDTHNDNNGNDLGVISALDVFVDAGPYTPSQNGSEKNTLYEEVKEADASRALENRQDKSSDNAEP